MKFQKKNYDPAVVKDIHSGAATSDSELMHQFVVHLQQRRVELCNEWVRRIKHVKLLAKLSNDEIVDGTATVYDKYVEALQSGNFESFQDHMGKLSERIRPEGVPTNEMLGIVLLLRDVLARSLFAKYEVDSGLLTHVLDVYEPAANRIASEVAVGFVQDRERTISKQQESIRELSTPVLQVRDKLLIIPIVGAMDPQRARQLTDQLLRAIRANRARVVVIDITGVASIDSNVANHLLQTVEASRLLGAKVIVTGLSPEIAHTLVSIGVNLKMHTMGDLQGGIEEAERLLGYSVATREPAIQG